MTSEPFHHACVFPLSKAAEKLNNTSMWVCRLDEELSYVTVVGAHVSPNASSMEKVSDLYETYSLEPTPKVEAWIKGLPEDKLVFQIKKMSFNDPDRREYFVNGVETVVFVPIYCDDKLWGVLEVWDSNKQRDYTEEDYAELDDVVKHLVTLISRE